MWCYWVCSSISSAKRTKQRNHTDYADYYCCLFLYILVMLSASPDEPTFWTRT